MIFDRIENLKLYAQIPYIKDIIQFIKEKDCLSLSVGEIPIRGKDLFVRVVEYVTSPSVERRLEAHHIYADVQCVVSGVERMGFSTQKNLAVLTAYDKKEDIEFLETPKDKNSVIVYPNEFVVFLPYEPHQPGCLYQKATTVKKLIFKVKWISSFENDAGRSGIF